MVLFRLMGMGLLWLKTSLNKSKAAFPAQLFLRKAF
jgi:hypothetical protein